MAEHQRPEEIASVHGLDPQNLPKHIGIIMDGNGRWARERSMPRVFGHRKGADRVREVVTIAGELGVSHLTLFAFSDENWKRPEAEISAIMRLLNIYLEKEKASLKKNRVRLKTIGQIERLPRDNQRTLRRVMDELSEGDGLTLTLALSYGSRSELVQVCRTLADRVRAGELSSADISAQLIEDSLFTKGFPELDLLIRTSGEQRISNFLLWQLAYAELYFTSTYWPDFDRRSFVDALRDYQRRQRRFGEVLEDCHVEPAAYVPGDRLCSNRELSQR